MPGGRRLQGIRFAEALLSPSSLGGVNPGGVRGSAEGGVPGLYVFRFVSAGGRGSRVPAACACRRRPEGPGSIRTGK